MKKKTLKEWNKSGKSFYEFFEPMDEVDLKLIEHINYHVPARFDDGVFIQTGECDFDKGGVSYYTTFCRKGESYFYLGILPKFKQSKF